MDLRNAVLGDFGATRGVISVGAYYALMEEEAPACFYSAEGPTERVDTPLPWDPLADLGNKPDIVAPGHGVHVALSHSGALPDDRVHSDVHHQAVVASGTSLAAAHVSGLIALLLHRVPDATAEDLRRVLIETAQPVQGQSPGIGCRAWAMDKYMQARR